MNSRRRKIALITGASKGLGFALAQKMSVKGYFVILNARQKKGLEAARAKLPNPAAAEILAADVSEKNFGTALAKTLTRLKVAHLDVVAHVAAVNHMGKIEETRIENAGSTLRINALSVITLAQATRRFLEAGESPRFVLVSSLMQYFAMPGRSVYAASKAAAEYFACAWGHELEAEKSPIVVKVFRPAGIETGFHGNTPTDGAAPKSDVSRMPPDESAGHLLALIEGGARELAPGAMNKMVAFVARHFPRLAGYLMRRRYRRALKSV